MTSVFWNNYNNFGEQTLYEDLIIESISIYGVDMLYVPKHASSFDRLYLEDDTAKFETSYPIDVYVKSYEGFEGDGNFMSKFGLEIKDQITFTIARRTFANDIGTKEAIVRPREGDLFYYPLDKKLFEIKYTESKAFHYKFGALQIYEVYCELYQYSDETFNTGDIDIDKVQPRETTNIIDFALKDESGNWLVDQSNNVIVDQTYTPAEIDPFADNIQLAIEANGIVDFTTDNPFAEGNR